MSLYRLTSKTAVVGYGNLTEFIMNKGTIRGRTLFAIMFDEASFSSPSPSSPPSPSPSSPLSR